MRFRGDQGFNRRTGGLKALFKGRRTESASGNRVRAAERNLQKHKGYATEHRISGRILARRRRPRVHPRAGQLHGLSDHGPRRGRRPLPRSRRGDHQQGGFPPRNPPAAPPPAADLRGGDRHEPHRPRGRGRTGHCGEKCRGLLDPRRDGDHHRRGHRPATTGGLLRPLRQDRICRIAPAIPLRAHHTPALRLEMGHRRAGQHRPQRRPRRRGAGMPHRLYLDLGRRARGTLSRKAARRTAPMGRRGVGPRPAERPHAQSDRRARTGADEAFGHPDQRGARRHRGRSGAGRGPRRRTARRSGARCFHARTARSGQSPALGP